VFSGEMARHVLVLLSRKVAGRSVWESTIGRDSV